MAALSGMRNTRPRTRAKKCIASDIGGRDNDIGQGVCSFLYRKMPFRTRVKSPS